MLGDRSEFQVKLQKLRKAKLEISRQLRAAETELVQQANQIKDLRSQLKKADTSPPKPKAAPKKTTTKKKTTSKKKK